MDDDLTNEGSTTYTMRVPKDLKKVFEEVVAKNDRTASQLIRDFMREYVKKNKQAELI